MMLSSSATLLTLILLCKGIVAPNTTGQNISAPRPGGYAFTLPANQKIVINRCSVASITYNNTK